MLNQGHDALDKRFLAQHTGHWLVALTIDSHIIFPLNSVVGTV
jgi:hypothetical protein